MNKNRYPFEINEVNSTLIGLIPTGIFMSIYYFKSDLFPNSWGAGLEIIFMFVSPLLVFILSSSVIGYLILIPYETIKNEQGVVAFIASFIPIGVFVGIVNILINIGPVQLFSWIGEILAFLIVVPLTYIPQAFFLLLAGSVYILIFLIENLASLLVLVGIGLLVGCLYQFINWIGHLNPDRKCKICHQKSIHAKIERQSGQIRSETVYGEWRHLQNGMKERIVSVFEAEEWIRYYECPQCKNMEKISSYYKRTGKSEETEETDYPNYPD